MSANIHIEFEYKNQGLPGFYSLIRQYPSSEFDSPYRSTVPMLCFWRESESGLDQFSHILGIDLPKKITLSFEYCVEVQKGKGRPSQTDLIVISDQYAVAIEAKYTESPYEKVKVWLGKSDNKRLVLQGWLELINKKVIDSEVEVEDVLNLPYQMIHRMASACFLSRPKNILVYQCFDLDQTKFDYYRTNLVHLIKLFSMPVNFSAFLINQQLEVSPEYFQLQQQWDAGGRRMSDVVLDGIKRSDFIGFSKPEVMRIV